ncbi:uncharacterized protein LOC125178615 isoform X1 [Hyalella azteca]|uniref:Uncharacterized protein LOC125178615 isoform X1 n=1 Tax=Hyalella azteca TaxID=294128 RepID=A0A979FRM7_HYAAZ|nr:uncharacterized protein LOC125178615 isoform X1 [Hyalella azteca]
MQKMNRGLLLLVVAAASVSAQDVFSTCALALQSLDYNMEVTVATCTKKYSTALQSYNTNPNCSWFVGPAFPNAEVCDPIVIGFNKCLLKTTGLLKADGSFDDAAFKKTALQNKCSSDAKFSTAYQPCRDSTRKYLNYNRFLYCLWDQVNI